MKIRNGFVSNSSSSSFIVFADKINDPSTLKAKDVKKEKIMILGKELCNGTDLFAVQDAKMLAYAQNNPYLKRCVWLRVADMRDTEYEDGFFTIPDSAKTGLSIEVDHHSSDDLECLKDRYEDLE